MCKLLIMTGISEGLVAEDFMRRMSVPMSKFNEHGIGYAAVASDGELFSQRWLNNNQFFDKSKVMTKEIAEQLQAYESRLPKGALESNYSEMGNINFQDVKTVLMHTRYATCGREFKNTHPFIDNDTALIHNGVIRNAFSTHYMTGLDVNKLSTCDSEAALQTYLSQGVNLDTSQAKGWLNLLTGYWAFGLLSRDSQSNRVLDVIRGTSNLYYMEIEGLGKVFTTDKDDALTVVKDMGLTFIKEPFLVDNNEMYRYNALTGQLIQSVDIKPKFKTYGTSNPKTTRTTTNTGTSNSSKKGKRPGENLIALVDAFKDDPDAMAQLPDIFKEGSTSRNLTIDQDKVKKHCNDQSFPLIDRLDIFDLVHTTEYVKMYETFPPMLREYIRGIDSEQGLKAARKLIKELYEDKEQSVG